MRNRRVRRRPEGRRSQTNPMDRRQFLRASGCGLVMAATSGLPGCSTGGHTRGAPTGIIDTHTHFYMPGRPQGVPWPSPDDPVLHRAFLPPEFERLARPLGVSGTVVVEASPWIEDNDWLLNLAEDHPVILGVVGNLPVGTPGFAGHLRRLSRRHAFKGIRIGTDAVSAALVPGRASDDLQRVTDADLTVDLLIPPDRLADAARLADRLPRLRLVVDHCANVPVGGTPPEAWLAGLRNCKDQPNVFMKFSGLVEGTGRRGGLAPQDPAAYASITRAVVSAFGPDRLLFGSNWPVSLLFASYETVLDIAIRALVAEAPGAMAAVFRDTAVRVYRLPPTRVTTAG